MIFTLLTHNHSEKSGGENLVSSAERFSDVRLQTVFEFDPALNQRKPVGDWDDSCCSRSIGQRHPVLTHLNAAHQIATLARRRHILLNSIAILTYTSKAVSITLFYK